MRFHSKLVEQRPLPIFPVEVVREEPSQCRVPIEVAVRAGPIHRAFIEALPDDWRADPGVEIFSRMLWLKRGWYPLPSGFHVDWGASAEFPERVETLVGNFGGCSFTEFVDDVVDLPDLAEGEHRSQWSQRVEEMVADGRLRTIRHREGVLSMFDNSAWHRATPADSTGWRLLVRAIRGLSDGRRRDPETFTCVRNEFRPRTSEEVARYAAYEA